MQPDFSIFKYPRGFIKILELVFSIIGFAVLAGYSGSGSIEATEATFHTNTTYKVKVEYPFGSNQYTYTIISASSLLNVTISGGVDGSFKSDAQFLVAVGVLAFLYTLAMGLLYTLVEIRLNALQLKIFYSVDFAATCVLTFFFLVGGGVWARGSDGVIDNIDYIYSTLCYQKSPCITDKPNYSGIIAAVCFGFLNFFLWAGNVWFTFKETPFFKWKKQPPTATTDGSESGSSRPAQKTEDTKPPPEST